MKWKRRAAFVSALGALVLMSLSITPASQAYTRGNCRWSNGNMLYFDASPYGTAAANARSDWGATATPVSFTPTSAANAEVVIDGKNFGNTGYDGITYYPPCYNGVYNQSQGQVTSYWNTAYTANVSTTYREQIMVHELGHAMGLEHAGTSSCSGQPIMYKSSDRYTVCGHVKPQADDIRGMNAIY